MEKVPFKVGLPHDYVKLKPEKVTVWPELMGEIGVISAWEIRPHYTPKGRVDVRTGATILFPDGNEVRGVHVKADALELIPEADVPGEIKTWVFGLEDARKAWEVNS